MPDKWGRTTVMLPQDVMERIVVPEQQRIFQETGEVLKPGMVVRRLLEMARAVDIQQPSSCVSSTAN